ncbi:hypothetical protein KKG31_03740 [Patescibacteria group bacterium]|nr:hypothetical protein [Patescibacteria group bacterium]
MKDYFEGNNYSAKKDSTIVFTQEKPILITLTKAKAEEFIDYVETIDAIKNHLEEEKQDIEIYAVAQIDS